MSEPMTTTETTPDAAARTPSGMLVVTGMSGAGKTQAMKALEDLDFF